MRIMTKMFILFLLSVSLSSVWAKSVPNVYTEDKRAIIVKADQPEFMIKVRSNPTTGYSWFLRDYDGNLIQPVKRTFEAPNQKIMGAPGYEVWTFRVKPNAFIVPQQTIIRFVYSRPWDAEEPGKQEVFRVSM